MRFKETGSCQNQKSTGRPRTSAADVERECESFQQSPRKSIWRTSRELGWPTTPAHRVFHKRSKLYAYKVQILQELNPNDGPQHNAFALEMLSRIDIEDDEDFLKKVMFTDEACFHVLGKVNRCNVRIWGSKNPHVVIEHIRDSPKVNVWCGLLHDRLVGPFLFAEDTVSSTIYMNFGRIRLPTDWRPATQYHFSTGWHSHSLGVRRLSSPE